MGFLDKLKLIFSKSKKGADKVEAKDVTTTDVKDTPAEDNDFAQAGRMEEPRAIPTPKQAHEPVFDPNTTGPHRDSKECPKCGAPNDQDIHKCWLCKSEI